MTFLRVLLGLGAAGMLLGGLAGCTGDDENDCRGVEPAVAALFGGDAGLPGNQDLAVVALLSASDDSKEKLCSGVLISSDFVLTAKHCAMFDEPVDVWVGRSLDAQVMMGRVDSFVPDSDPDRDLAIAVLEQPIREVKPIELLSDGVPAVDDEVTLAGFGLTQDDEIGQQRFVQERVSAVDDEHITVDGKGATGACVGDSGGPLLLPSADDPSVYQVAGILSVGSASCTDLDVYQRVDTLTGAIKNLIEPSGSAGTGAESDPGPTYGGGC